MATAKLPEDREVLRAKFENANRLLRVHADGIKTFEAKVETLLILEPDPTPETMLAKVKEAMIPISGSGVDTSLIDHDLQSIKAELGNAFQSQLQALSNLLNAAHQRTVSAKAASDRDLLVAASDDFVFAVKSLLNLALRPTRELRNRLRWALNKGPKQPIETDGHAKRRERDQRLRWLSKTHDTRSPANVLKLAKADPLLAAHATTEAKLTLDIVRNVLQTSRSGSTRRKSKRAKNTCQGKTSR